MVFILEWKEVSSLVEVIKVCFGISLFALVFGFEFMIWIFPV